MNQNIVVIWRLFREYIDNLKWCELIGILLMIQIYKFQVSSNLSPQKLIKISKKLNRESSEVTLKARGLVPINVQYCSLSSMLCDTVTMNVGKDTSKLYTLRYKRWNKWMSRRPTSLFFDTPARFCILVTLPRSEVSLLGALYFVATIALNGVMVQHLLALRHRVWGKRVGIRGIV